MNFPVPAEWTEARDMLLPVVRRATEPAHAFRAEQASPENRLVRRPLGKYLSELVMIDLPDVRMYINHGHLKQWGVSSRQAFEAAHNVLRDYATSGLKLRAEYKLWHLDAPDGSASSRLALPGWLDAFADQVSGTPVAIIPSPRLLLVGGMDDDGQLARLIDIASDGFHMADSPLSPALYISDATGRPMPLQLSPVTKRHLRVQANLRELCRRVYNEQAEQLSPYLDVDFAPCEITTNEETGETSTWCVWEAGSRPVWLPETDFIVLRDNDGDWWLPTDRIERLVQGVWDSTPAHPRRHQARWPMEETLRKLKACSEPR